MNVTPKGGKRSMRTVDAGGPGTVCGWPLERADEALEALARRSGLARGQSSGERVLRRPAAAVRPQAGGSEAETPVDAAAEDGLGPWIETVATDLGLELEETETSHSDAESMIRGCGPALLRIPSCAPGAPSCAPGDAGTPYLLAVLGSARAPLARGSRGGRVRLLGPDLAVHRRPVSEVASRLSRSVEATALPEVERLLERLALPARRAARARRALLRERLRSHRLEGCWLLRLPPGASFWHQMRDEGLPGELAKYLVAYGLSFGLVLLSWWTLGRGALNGHLSRDWLLAWALILITLIVPRQVSIWAQAKLAAGAGTLLKRRLLSGALKLEPDEIRHQGAGQLLGRVIESEAMQTHALLGGFLATVAVIELAMSAWVLSRGAAPWTQVILLVLWAVVLLGVGWRYFELRRRWTDDRLGLTHELVESLVGHRTRLAQERRERWHEREDRLLEGYLTSSRRMDRRRAFLIVSSFAWVSIGIAGMLPAFVIGGSSVGAMALSVGGVLLAFRAFNKLSRGFTYLTGAWISWRQAAPLFHAAARDEDASAGLDLARSFGSPAESRGAGGSGAESAPEVALLEAQELVYRYSGRARPVLDGLSLAIHRGDRILIEGPSGGGKSTLAAILTRLRPPASGLLLLGGLDRHTVRPDVWRRHVVSAPQFHENHVFTETFAFNLLMGRRWPPRRQDMADARAVCRELGLGELLERMPAGLLQLVGETGWQLSHGERSRLFMARALLQGTELVILDESFAALDPENLHRALHSALERAPTLLIIAHP